MHFSLNRYIKENYHSMKYCFLPPDKGSHCHCHCQEAIDRPKQLRLILYYKAVKVDISRHWKKFSHASKIVQVFVYYGHIILVTEVCLSALECADRLLLS